MGFEESSRRGFLSAVTGVCFGLVGLAVAIPGIAYLAFPVRRRIVESNNDFVPLGRLRDFPAGTVKRVEVVARRRDAWTVTEAAAIGAVYVDRLGDGVRVFSTACPHLSCDVEWEGKQFACPCHKSAFGRDGKRLSGPSRRGLDPIPHRIRNGMVEVRYVRYQPDREDRVPV